MPKGEVTIIPDSGLVAEVMPVSLASSLDLALQEVEPEQDQRSTAVPRFQLYHSVNQLSKKWPKHDFFMAKTWSSHGPLPSKWPKYGPFMTKTWSSHGPSNWFFLNHNQCAPICSMPNFTILGVCYSPLFLEMGKIWPFYGQSMVLTWSFK